jgi:heme exporter protein D
MDGYAIFVWPSYILTAVVLIGLAIWSIGARRSSTKKLEMLQPLADARRAARRGARQANATVGDDARQDDAQQSNT